MTIQAAKLDQGLEREISIQPGCETVARCFACGACSGVCPVEKVVPEFDPRKIVHMVALGLTDRLLGTDVIWACSQCQSCVPVCPQQVRCSDVIKALRQEAVRRGKVTTEMLAALGQFAKVDAGKCVACLTCVRLCPFGAPHIADEGYAYIEPELCKGCGICVLECPAEAISLAPSLEEKGTMV